MLHSKSQGYVSLWVGCLCPEVTWRIDISRPKLSVLTPIDTALIGLREGQSIARDTRSGDARRLTLLEVRH